MSGKNAARRGNARLFIKQDVARHGMITPEGVRVFKLSSLSEKEFKQAAAEGLELFERWNPRRAA